MPQNNLSYVAGDRSQPLLDQTIPQAFAETVAKYGDREAAVFCATGKRITYAEFDLLVDRLAAGLLELGLEKGERIGIWGPNRIEWLLTQFASARLGLILVCINPAYRLMELEYALNKVECRALVMADHFKTSNYVEMIEALAPEIKTASPGELAAARLPHLQVVIHMGDEQLPGMYRFADVAQEDRPVDKARLDSLSAQLDPHEPINIQFTSGTTGAPKGATLTHHNIINNSIFTTSVMRYTEHDRVCIPVPLYHCFGMVVGTLGSITKGAVMIFPEESFDPVSTLRAVDQERCTSLYGVPTMFAAELDHPEFKNFNMSSLRTGVMAGSPCPIELMKRVIAEMNMSEITIAYGMTEVGPLSFQTSVDDPLEMRVSSVGRVHPHVEVKIVDTEGQTVPVGVEGEIWTASYGVMTGYWNDPERTNEAMDEEGWMRSGDLGVLDKDGYLNISGRLKDMVIRGGENIFPREIEEFLYRNPKVQQAQVFGVPDEKYGEELCAWIELKRGETSSEEEIREFFKGQIAHFKIPRYIRFVEEFPMTVTGKVQKFKMRQMMGEELGLAAE
ncbi:MAG: AMP-binding protein [Rhizobiaceae bacterium]